MSLLLGKPVGAGRLLHYGKGRQVAFAELLAHEAPVLGLVLGLLGVGRWEQTPQRRVVGGLSEECAQLSREASEQLPLLGWQPEADLTASVSSDSAL